MPPYEIGYHTTCNKGWLKKIIRNQKNNRHKSMNYIKEKFPAISRSYMQLLNQSMT